MNPDPQSAESADNSSERDGHFGLLAVLVPEADGQVAVKYFDDLKFELGKSGGRVINWRYFGRPGGSDDIYRSMCNPQLRAHDEASLVPYLEDCRLNGGESHRTREMYRDLAAMVGMELSENPFVLATSAPDNGVRATLGIPVSLFDTPKSRRLLSRFLLENLTDENALEHSDNGFFYPPNMERIQAWLSDLELELQRLADSIDPNPMNEAPCLVLEEIPVGERHGRFRTRLTGQGRLAGLKKSLGARQLFFVESFVRSDRVEVFRGTSYTALELEALSAELIRWADSGMIKFSGADSPKNRLTKMWGQFIRMIGNEPLLRGVFVDKPYDNPVGERLFLMRMLPSDMQSRIKHLESLYRRP